MADRQESFIDRFADVAIAVSQATGMAPEVVLGQTALETGWGKSVAGNNMFGVKGKGQTVTTKEDYGRGLQTVRESFRAYDNPEDSFADYGRLMNTDRYNGIGPNQSVSQQIAAIGKSGYATDRAYASKLGSVVDRIQESRVFQDKVVNATAALTPAVVDPFLGDIGVPIGQVTALGPVPDLTPQQPASAGSFFGGFDIGDVTLSNDVYGDIMGGLALNDFAPVDYGQTYPEITEGIFGNPLDSFTPVDAAPIDFSGVRQGMTEQQAIDAMTERSGQAPRYSENVEVRHNGNARAWGDDIDAAILDQEMRNADTDVIIGVGAGHYGGFEPLDPSSWSGIGTLNAFEADPALGSITDFSDMTRGILHDDPVSMPDVSPSAGMIPGAASIMDATGFNTGWDATPQTGFSAGFNEGPWGATPDFDAPSLAARNNVDKFDGAMAVRNQSTPTNEDIAASVMSELAPSAPQLSTPSFDPQAAAMGDWADKVSPSSLSTPSVATQATPTRTAGPTSTSPQGDFAAPERVSRAPSLSAPTPPSRPSTEAPALPSAAPSFTDTVLDGLGLSAPINSVKSGLSDVFGSSTDFVNAMSNPQIAESYTPGLFDGWTGDVLQGAALGALTGGPFGAVTGGLFGGLNIGGRIGSHLSNANGGLFGQGFGGFLDTMANPFNGMSPQDIAAYGLDGDWTTREPTRNTGFEGGATRGDGSYSDHAGYNDNNPQGIL